MKWTLILVVCAVFLVISGNALAIEVLEEARIDISKSDNVIANTQLLCIDGKKFVQTVATGYGTGAGVGVTIIQIYEAKTGTMVPAKCREK
ncbi:MAG: hypothetical protein ACC669_08855 [bacterium]